MTRKILINDVLPVAVYGAGDLDEATIRRAVLACVDRLSRPDISNLLNKFGEIPLIFAWDDDYPAKFTILAMNQAMIYTSRFYVYYLHWRRT